MYYLFAQVAIGHDEISQFQSEGFRLRCILVDAKGVKENQEEMWGMFLMTYSEDVPEVQIIVSLFCCFMYLI